MSLVVARGISDALVSAAFCDTECLMVMDDEMRPVCGRGNLRRTVSVLRQCIGVG